LGRKSPCCDYCKYIFFSYEIICHIYLLCGALSAFEN
jgi:hypothetical protein